MKGVTTPAMGGRTRLRLKGSGCPGTEAEAPIQKVSTCPSLLLSLLPSEVVHRAPHSHTRRGLRSQPCAPSCRRQLAYYSQFPGFPGEMESKLSLAQALAIHAQGDMDSRSAWPLTPGTPSLSMTLTEYPRSTHNPGLTPCSDTRTSRMCCSATH